ncbi:MAG: hypothetical protein ACKVZJ_02225 [Phycisphaerales bacterium]
MVDVLVGIMVWVKRLFQRPVRPGSTIMLERARKGEERFGTYGCMVWHAGKKYLLSCAHVFERGKTGDGAICFDIRSGVSERTVGRLARVVRSEDFALVESHWSARVLPTFPPSVGRVDPTPFPIESLSFVPSNTLNGRALVQSLGAVSTHAKGFAASGVFLTMTYTRTAAKKRKSAEDSQSDYTLSPPFIEVKPDLQNTPDFCKKGDSGALLLTAPKQGLPQPLGLLVGIRKDGLGDFGLAVPIQRVLDEIGKSARIYVGGR